LSITAKKYKKLVPIKLPAKIGFLSAMGDLQGCGLIRVITPYNMLPYLNIPKLRIDTSYISNFIGDIDLFIKISVKGYNR